MYEFQHNSASPVMSDFELDGLCQKFRSLKPFLLGDEAKLSSSKFDVLERMLPEFQAKVRG